MAHSFLSSARHCWLIHPRYYAGRLLQRDEYLVKDSVFYLIHTLFTNADTMSIPNP